MTSKDLIKKSVLSLLVAGLVLASITISGAQFLSAIPGCGNLNLGSVKVSPFVQAGYKNISFNLNLPFQTVPVDPTGFLVFYGPAPLDLRFAGASAWVGTIGINAQLLPNWFLTVKAEGNAPTNIRVVTGEHYNYYGVASQSSWDWNGSGLKWWDADCMVGYTFYKNWSATVGLRYDNLTVNMAAPLGNGVTVAGATTNYNQDVVAQTWIPYIGLQFDEPNYYAQLLYSPFASPQVTAPQSFNGVSSTGSQAGEMYYKFTKGGSFLEVFFDYKFPRREFLKFDLWAKGTWMWISGNGDWSLWVLNNFAGFPPSTNANPQSVTGTFDTHALSVGVTASLSF